MSSAVSSAMCLQRASHCQLLLINDNRSGSVYIWHNTALARMATVPAHCWEIGIFLNFIFPFFSFLFFVGASRELHMLKNKTAREKLEAVSPQSHLGSISEVTA